MSTPLHATFTLPELELPHARIRMHTTPLPLSYEHSGFHWLHGSLSTNVGYDTSWAKIDGCGSFNIFPKSDKVPHDGSKTQNCCEDEWTK